MKRFTEKTVFCGLVTAWRFAAWPTRRSPVLVKATTEGVVRAPSEFSSTEGSCPSMTAMQEFVVPRSIPRIFGIGFRDKDESVVKLAGATLFADGAPVRGKCGGRWG